MKLVNSQYSKTLVTRVVTKVDNHMITRVVDKVDNNMSNRIEKTMSEYDQEMPPSQTQTTDQPMAL